MSVAQPDQEEYRGVISVKDFGAKGDGITDDTAAIQAAVDFASTEALVAAWMESLEFEWHHGKGIGLGYWSINQNSSLEVSSDTATFFYKAHVAAVAEEHEKWVTASMKRLAKYDSTGIPPETQALIDAAVAEAKESVAFAIVSTKTEGIIDDGDVFIKQEPLNQTIINIVGYEKFRAMQEAVNVLFK